MTDPFGMQGPGMPYSGPPMMYQWQPHPGIPAPPPGPPPPPAVAYSHPMPAQYSLQAYPHQGYSPTLEASEAIVENADTRQSIVMKFIEVLLEHGDLDPTHEQILNIFIQLPTFERKVIMKLGSIKAFLLQDSFISMVGGKLHVNKEYFDLLSEKTEISGKDDCQKNSIIEESFEARAYRQGIVVEEITPTPEKKDSDGDSAGEWDADILEEELEDVHFPDDDDDDHDHNNISLSKEELASLEDEKDDEEDESSRSDEEESVSQSNDIENTVSLERAINHYTIEDYSDPIEKYAQTIVLDVLKSVALEIKNRREEKQPTDLSKKEEMDLKTNDHVLEKFLKKQIEKVKSVNQSLSETYGKYKICDIPEFVPRSRLSSESSVGENGSRPLNVDSPEFVPHHKLRSRMSSESSVSESGSRLNVDCPEFVPVVRTNVLGFNPLFKSTNEPTVFTPLLPSANLISEHGKDHCGTCGGTSVESYQPPAATQSKCCQTEPAKTKDASTSYKKIKCHHVGIATDKKWNVRDICLNTIETMAEENSSYHVRSVETVEQGMNTETNYRCYSKKVQAGNPSVYTRSTSQQTETTDIIDSIDAIQYDEMVSRALAAEEQILQLQMHMCLSELIKTMHEADVRYSRQISKERQVELAGAYRDAIQEVEQQINRVEILFDSNLSSLRDGCPLHLLPKITFTAPTMPPELCQVAPLQLLMNHSNMGAFGDGCQPGDSESILASEVAQVKTFLSQLAKPSLSSDSGTRVAEESSSSRESSQEKSKETPEEKSGIETSRSRSVSEASAAADTSEPKSKKSKKKKKKDKDKDKDKEAKSSKSEKADVEVPSNIDLAPDDSKSEKAQADGTEKTPPDASEQGTEVDFAVLYDQLSNMLITQMPHLGLNPQLLQTTTLSHMHNMHQMKLISLTKEQLATLNTLSQACRSPAFQMGQNMNPMMMAGLGGLSTMGAAMSMMQPRMPGLAAAPMAPMMPSMLMPPSSLPALLPAVMATLR